MSREDNFKDIYEDVKAFQRTLGKDNVDRRSNLELTQKYLKRLDKLKSDLKVEIQEFENETHNPNTVEQIEAYIESIEKHVVTINNTLRERLSSCSTVLSNSEEVRKKGNIINIEMSEKFDLKTAAAIIPSMGTSEDSIKMVIDAVELYDSLLDENGKKVLTTYVLKTRITENAKLRLEKSYASNKQLISDMKNRLLKKKSAAALSLQLHNLRQNRKSIEEFGKSVEELMVNLTLAQSDNNDQVATALAEINEKIAVNTFANGLYDNELRVVVKARNYSKLKDAIIGAQDEETSKKNNAQIFNFRGRGSQYKTIYRNSGGRGRNNFGSRTGNNFSSRPTRDNTNFARSNQNRGRGHVSYSGQNRGHNSKYTQWQNSSRSNSRDVHSHTHNVKRGYHMQNDNVLNEPSTSSSTTGDEFFRAPL